MSRTVKRLLLLSGASLVGQNILASLAGRRDGLHLVAANSVAREPVLFEFDAAYLTPPLRADVQAYERRFEEILHLTEPDLVIACRDDDAAFLADHGARHPRLRRRCAVGDPVCAALMLDKLESWNFSRQHGLPFVPTLAASAEPGQIARFVQEHGWPLLAKPREGFASQGVKLLFEPQQLERLGRDGGYVLQRCLGDRAALRSRAAAFAAEGLPLFHSFEEVKTSLQAIIAPGGTVSGTFATKNTMRQGRSVSVEIAPADDAAALTRRCAAVFAGAGWRGPLNVQCQRDADGTLMIYEFNGRCTGATAARRWLGFDEVALLLRDWLDHGLPAATVPAAASVVRASFERLVEPDKVDRLQRDGFWHASTP